jgi:hypothetical protein
MQELEEDDEKEDQDKEDLGNTSTTIWKVTTAVATFVQKFDANVAIYPFSKQIISIVQI